MIILMYYNSTFLCFRQENRSKNAQLKCNSSGFVPPPPPTIGDLPEGG